MNFLSKTDLKLKNVNVVFFTYFKLLVLTNPKRFLTPNLDVKVNVSRKMMTNYNSSTGIYLFWQSYIFFSIKKYSAFSFQKNCQNRPSSKLQHILF